MNATVTARTLETVSDQAARRRGALIWALLFFNGLAYNDVPLLVPFPSALGKILTQSALGVALVLACLFNRRLLIRPNVFLTLVTIVTAASFISTVRLGTGVGSLAREVRLCAFLGVLWLLTPLWGRRDLLLARWHLRCLMAICLLVTAGLAVSPGGAFAVDGRLSGTIWPIPPTQVGHYAAAMVGISAVLWMAGMLSRRTALLATGGGIAVLLLSQTRTAMLALLAGVLCATAFLFMVRRRARRVVAIVLVVVPLAFVAVAPAITGWFERGQSSTEISGFTGRTQIWDLLVQAPRDRLQEWFGSGLSNKSFDGHPIDNSWLAIYQEQGLFGDFVVGGSLLFLLILALFRRRQPGAAVAVFLVVYCAIASFTETGLGDVSPYLLDLTVAASLLAVPAALPARSDLR